jgi:hypothetical protein
MPLNRTLLLWLVIVASAAGLASAQTPQTATLRVTKDQSIIWRAGFIQPATLVKAGTTLEAIARQGDWYEVLLPVSAANQTGDDRGFIAVSQVELISGSVPRERTVPEAPSAGGTTAAAAEVSAPARTGLRAFGHVGYGWFMAHKTFRAIFDQPGALWYGGGAEFRHRTGVFVQAAIQNFRQTGERVFVFEDEVMKLGISDTVTIMPVNVTLGYRTTRGRGASYVGAGIGRYFYKEKFEFADDAEMLDERLTS